MVFSVAETRVLRRVVVFVVVAVGTETGGSGSGGFGGFGGPMRVSLGVSALGGFCRLVKSMRVSLRVSDFGGFGGLLKSMRVSLGGGAIAASSVGGVRGGSLALGGLDFVDLLDLEDELEEGLIKVFGSGDTSHSGSYINYDDTVIVKLEGEKSA